MLLRFLFLLVGLISVCAGPYLTWRRIAGRRPLIADPGQRLARRLRSYQWLERIAPVLAKSPSGSRSALSGMVEKYLLLVRKRPRGKRDTGEASERLRGVLEATADLEGLAREIESQLDDAELARVTQRYDALQARLDACVDVRDQEALAREKAALADQLAAFSRLDEMHSSLSNRLIHAEAVFNRLVGAQLVLQAPYDEVELESLADSLQRVRLEIEAQCELSGTGDAVA